MLVAEHLSVDGRETQSNQTQGCTSSDSAQEIRSVSDPVRRGNAAPADLISTQPRPAAAPLEEATKEAAVIALPQTDLQRPTCPRCGLAAPDAGPAPPSSRLSGLQGSRSTVHSSSRRSRSKASVAGSQRTAATPADPCFHLLLACLSCRCSALLLALLEACSSCLHALCSGCGCCAAACARCCSAVREVPVEELNCHAHCHAVLFESCCEPTECLEFCLDCCDICHRS